jgi:hypothetical protein
MNLKYFLGQNNVFLSSETWTLNTLHDSGAEEIYEISMKSFYSCCWGIFSRNIPVVFHVLLCLWIIWLLLVSGHNSSVNDHAIAACLNMLSILTGFWRFSGSFQMYTEIIFLIWTRLLHMAFPRYYSRIILSFEGVYICYWKLYLVKDKML